MSLWAGPGSVLRFSSRSDLNRCLLALTFIVTAFSLSVHVASYFGLAVIASRAWQISLNVVLCTSLVWVAVRASKLETRSVMVLTRGVRIAAALCWLNTFLYACSFIEQSVIWRVSSRLLHLGNSDPAVMFARRVSAGHLGLGVALLFFLWSTPILQALDAASIESGTARPIE